MVSDPVRTAVLFQLTALVALAVGCADVRPPALTAAGPAGALQAGVVSDPATEGGVVAEPISFEGADPSEEESAEGDAHDEGDEGEEEDAADPHAEHDDEHGEETDVDAFNACLDRGPGSPPHCPQFTWKSPIDGLSQEDIRDKVKTDMASLGPISVGAPNRGRLFNGVQMPKDERWKQNDPGNAWGTQETVDSIVKAVDKVHAAHKDTPALYIGHLSAKAGGHLKPHKSHQSGRDVDLSYFYTEDKGWYALATEKNLDRARTWTLVKAFLEDPNSEMILIDTSLQKLLMAYALEKGEEKAFIERVFQVSGKSQSPIIRHARGHATHIHVRFFSPSAQTTGRLAAAFLPKPVAPPKRKGSKTKGKGKGETEKDAGVASAKGKPKTGDFVLHRARSGDTLDALSRRYAVSVLAIKKANGLKSNDLKINKTYRIPRAEK